MPRPGRNPSGCEGCQPLGTTDVRSLPRHSPRSYTPRRAPGSALSRDSEGRAGEAALEAGGGAVALEGGSGNNEGNFRMGRPRVPELAVPLPPRSLQRPRWLASWTPPLVSVCSLGPLGTGSREPAGSASAVRAPARLRCMAKASDYKGGLP